MTGLPAESIFGEQISLTSAAAYAVPTNTKLVASANNNFLSCSFF